jgi:succinate dehydrogenase / fumarate reductase flavoprotein subunit
MAGSSSSVRSQSGKVRRVVVVGGGLAGLMTVIKLCEAGVPVDLFSLVPVRRSHSVCAQGGINASVNTRGEGDSPKVHLEETIYGGDFLANQPPVKAMCDAAPNIVFMLDRMGVPFNRTAEGLLDFRRFGGTLFHRTAFAGATTGQQLLYALDEQVRRWETVDVEDEKGVTVVGEKMVRKLEWWDFLALVLDDEGTRATPRSSAPGARCPRARATTSSRRSIPLTATWFRATSPAASCSAGASTRNEASSIRRAARTRTRCTST